MSEAEFSKQEWKAIRSLQQLGRRWPKSLKLFSWSGHLLVFRTKDWERCLAEGGRFGDLLHESIPGIPNDGGDPD